jgi:hypothetical protein
MGLVYHQKDYKWAEPVKCWIEKFCVFASKRTIKSDQLSKNNVKNDTILRASWLLYWK